MDFTRCLDSLEASCVPVLNVGVADDVVRFWSRKRENQSLCVYYEGSRASVGLKSSHMSIFHPVVRHIRSHERAKKELGREGVWQTLQKCKKCR